MEFNASSALPFTETAECFTGSYAWNVATETKISGMVNSPMKNLGLFSAATFDDDANEVFDFIALSDLVSDEPCGRVRGYTEDLTDVVTSEPLSVIDATALGLSPIRSPVKRKPAQKVVQRHVINMTTKERSLRFDASSDDAGDDSSYEDESEDEHVSKRARHCENTPPSNMQKKKMTKAEMMKKAKKLASIDKFKQLVVKGATKLDVEWTPALLQELEKKMGLTCPSFHRSVMRNMIARPNNKFYPNETMIFKWDVK